MFTRCNIPTIPTCCAAAPSVAGHMESDYAAAEGREREAKNRANRRRHWLERGWRISAKGNEYLNTDSFNIVMFRFGQGWKARISQREGAHERVSQRTYL